MLRDLVSSLSRPIYFFDLKLFIIYEFDNVYCALSLQSLLSCNLNQFKNTQLINFSTLFFYLIGCFTKLKSTLNKLKIKIKLNQMNSIKFKQALVKNSDFYNFSAITKRGVTMTRLIQLIFPNIITYLGRTFKEEKNDINFII